MKIFTLFIIVSILSVILGSCTGEKDYEHFPEGGYPSGEVTPDEPDTPSATVAFADTVVSVLKNTGKIELPLVLSEKLSEPVNINVKIINTEGGVEGIDFRIPDNKATIEKDTLKGSVNVILADDGKINEDWNFTVELSQVSGDPAPARTGKAIRCHVQVSSNSFISFGKVEFTTSEKTNQTEALEIPLKVIGELKEPVTVKIASKSLELANAAEEGVNFEIENPEITLEAGATSGSIRIKTLNDHQVNGTSIAELEITEVSGGNTIIGRANQYCRINIEDDNYSISLATPSLTLNETEETCSIPLTVSKILTEDLTVNLTTTGTAIAGSHFTAAESLTIPAGKAQAKLEINLLGNGADNRDLEAVWSIADIDDIHKEWAVISDLTSRLTIENVDARFEGDYTVNENGGNYTLPFKLSRTYSSPVTVKLKITDGSAKAGTDVNLSTSEIIIPANTSEGVIPFSIIDNHMEEITRQFAIEVVSPASEGKNNTILTINSFYKTLFGNYDFKYSIYGNGWEAQTPVTYTINNGGNTNNNNQYLICQGKISGFPSSIKISYDRITRKMEILCNETIGQINFSDIGTANMSFQWSKYPNKNIPVTLRNHDLVWDNFEGGYINWNYSNNSASGTFKFIAYTQFIKK